MNCSNAKRIPLIQLLARQGFNPAFSKTRKGVLYYWFMSPFRKETKPSFSVNTELNTFYDYGNGLSGTVVDYMCSYYNCDISKALTLLDNFNLSFSFPQHCVSRNVTAAKEENMEDYEITSVGSIKHKALQDYLKRRKLNLTLATKYLNQINYRIKGRSYFGIAFRNLSEGYEVSYEYKGRENGDYIRVKSCLLSKDMSFFDNKCNSLVVTESWSDFLALLTLYPKMERRNDFVILNSVSMQVRLLNQINKSDYDTIYSATDNDAAGLQVLKQLTCHYGDKVVPLNELYRQYKDVAEFVENQTEF